MDVFYSTRLARWKYISKYVFLNPWPGTPRAIARYIPSSTSDWRRRSETSSSKLCHFPLRNLKVRLPSPNSARTVCLQNQQLQQNHRSIASSTPKSQIINFRFQFCRPDRFFVEVGRNFHYCWWPSPAGQPGCPGASTVYGQSAFMSRRRNCTKLYAQWLALRTIKNN